MCFARDRQDFVRPNFGVTVDRDIRWHLPIAGFMCRHVMNQLLLEWVDLHFEFLFRQGPEHLREERVYHIVIPKPVEFLLANTSPTRRFIAYLECKCISAFICQG